MRRLLQLGLLMASLVWCTSTNATTAYVSGVAAYGSSTGVTTRTTGTYTPASTSNIMVAFVGGASNTITVSSIVDVSNGNHAFTQGTSCRSATTTTSADFIDWWYEVVQSTSATTFTATYSSSLTFDGLIVSEVSGANTSTPFDFCTIATLVTSSTSITSPSFTPTAGDENLFGADSPGGAISTWTAGTNYTLRLNHTNPNFAVESRDNAPGSAQTASISVNTAVTLKGVVISLKPAAAVGATQSMNKRRRYEILDEQ